MASLSIPPPRKISDSQFIGDLMVLLERRKIKCGDPSSLDNFARELGSNNALRGDLFTLCTAISHMAAQDLTGEELLVLVARALGGPSIAKGAAAPEIPESMRKAFLEGYEAWGNRAALAMQEPAAWPPPRRVSTSAGDEPTTETQSIPAEQRDPAEGTRTIQEALDIARERSPKGVLGLNFNALSPNIEHLTISELKKLLEDIEHRVSRIEPNLGQMSADPPARASDVATQDAPIPRRAVLTFEPPTESLPGESESTKRGGPASRFDEDAFLTRHPYLKSSARNTQAAEETAAVPGPNPLPIPGVAEPQDAAVPASLDAPAEASPDAPVVAAAPTADTPDLAIGTNLTPAPMEFLAGYSQGVVQLNPRARVAVKLAGGFVFLMLLTLCGLYVYRATHPNTLFDYTRFKPAAQSTSPQPDPQVAVPVPDVSHANPRLQPPVRSGAKATAGPKGLPSASQGPVASVWPPSNQASRDAGAQDVPAPETVTAGSRKTSPVHVDAAANVSSGTIIGFATKPVHAEQANGVSGTVMVEVSISKQGNVTSARVISGPQELRSAAIQTVQQWKFKPYLVDGVPAEVTTTLGVYVKGD